MPTVSPGQPDRPPEQSHQARAVAESFGADAAGYDRARPGYPDALVARIVAESPGPRLLDVGCGTGIAARQFQAAGCTVLGIDPDPRMAAFACGRGLPVEVATFEAWDPADRMFDTVIAAQSWHWVDPEAGAAKAARILRPGGRLAIFSHVYEPPPEVAEPSAAAYRRVAPDSPFADLPDRRPLGMYQAMYAGFADTIRATGHFSAPEQWRFDWERTYARDEWLALLPTTGGFTRLRPDQLAAVLDQVGSAIDALGGAFTMPFVTLVATAARAGVP